MAPKAPKKPAAQKQPAKQSSKPRPPRTRNVDARQDARLAALEAKTTGPKVAERWTTTVNLGTIAGDDAPAFRRQAHVFLHPALARDVDSPDGPTPTSVRAAQYSMYSIQSAQLVCHPLVGPSGVAGTLGVAALQLDSSVGAATSFDAVAARQHRTLAVGERRTFSPKLPRDWWYTDTNAHTGAESLGPSLEFFTLGAAQNIYTNQTYAGALWRLTCRVTYQFANYQPTPSIAALDAGTEEHQVTVKNNESGEVLLETASPLLGAHRATSAPGIDDLILGVVDLAGGLAANIPLVGPLLQTGLAFLRPIFKPSGSNVTGHQYLVCSSFDAARQGKGITAPVTQATSAGTLRTQQLCGPETVQGGTRALHAATQLPAADLTMAPASQLPATTAEARRFPALLCWRNASTVQFTAGANIGVRLRGYARGSHGTTPVAGGDFNGRVFRLPVYNDQRCYGAFLALHGGEDCPNAICIKPATGDSALWGSALLLLRTNAIPVVYNATPPGSRTDFGWFEMEGFAASTPTDVVNWCNNQGDAPRYVLPLTWSNQSMTYCGYLLMAPGTHASPGWVRVLYYVPGNEPANVPCAAMLTDSSGFVRGDTAWITGPAGTEEEIPEDLWSLHQASRCATAASSRSGTDSPWTTF